MNASDAGVWSGNWAWSLPLIVLNVIIHVIGLVLINESVVGVLSGKGRMSAAIEVTQEPDFGPRSVREHRSLLVLASLAFAVGGTSGHLGALFRLVLERSDRLRSAIIDWAHGKEIAGFALVIGISAIATGLAAWLVRKFAPGAKGSGIPDAEMLLRNEHPPSPLILIPVKFLGGVLAMGAGLALGREGPTVQMGAGIGHFIAKLRKLMPQRSVRAAFYPPNQHVSSEWSPMETRALWDDMRRLIV